MRFAESIKLLAADAATQIRCLGDVPENAGVRDYVKTNAIYRMAWLYCHSCWIDDDIRGNETAENWLARTELSPDMIRDHDTPFWKSVWRLWTVLDMILRIDRPFLFSAHSLRNSREWVLVRYLASETCRLGGFSPALVDFSFESLWTALGDGILGKAPGDPTCR